MTLIVECRPNPGIRPPTKANGWGLGRHQPGGSTPQAEQRCGVEVARLTARAQSKSGEQPCACLTEPLPCGNGVTDGHRSVPDTADHGVQPGWLVGHDDDVADTTDRAGKGDLTCDRGDHRRSGNRNELETPVPRAPRTRRAPEPVDHTAFDGHDGRRRETHDRRECRDHGRVRSVVGGCETRTQLKNCLRMNL